MLNPKYETRPITCNLITIKNDKLILKEKE